MERVEKREKQVNDNQQRAEFYEWLRRTGRRPKRDESMWYWETALMEGDMRHPHMISLTVARHMPGPSLFKWFSGLEEAIEQLYWAYEKAKLHGWNPESVPSVPGAVRLLMEVEDD